MLDKIVGAEFLDEPAWKWFIALGLMMIALIIWRRVVNEIKG